MRKEPSLLARACWGWTPLYYRNILGDTMDISRCIKTGKRMFCAVNNPKKLGHCPCLTCLSPSPLGKKSCLDSKDPTMGHSPWLEAFKHHAQDQTNHLNLRTSKFTMARLVVTPKPGLPCDLAADTPVLIPLPEPLKTKGLFATRSSCPAA